MSRAFVKEDVEVPERSTRRRSASGLPPGALNYLTRSGADRLRAELAEQRQAGKADEETARLQGALDSATIVEPSPQTGGAAGFGSTVTVESSDGTREVWRIVGVDELHHDPRHVSWVSPMGRALLGVRPGQKLKLPGTDPGVRTVVEIG